MTGVKIKIQPFEDDFLKKSGLKWPKRLLLKSLFGSQELLHNLQMTYGQVIQVKNSSGQSQFFKVYKSSLVQDHQSLWGHPDLRVTKYDEIPTIWVVKSPNHCSAIKVKLENEELTDTIKSSILARLENWPVTNDCLMQFNHYGKMMNLRIDLKLDLSEEMSEMSMTTSTPIRNTNKNVQIVTEQTEIEYHEASSESLKDVQEVGGLDAEFESIFQQMEMFKTKSYLGILLFGVSGSGKSLLSQRLQSRLPHFQPITIHGSDIFSQFSGETESQLKSMFKQTELKDSIIIIDDIDVLTSNNANTDQERRVKACLKVLLDECSRSTSQKTLLIATSSRPDNIDPSFRRPGRLESEIELPVPNANQRYQIIQAILKNVKMELSEEDIKTLSQNAHGYVGADLEALVAQVSQGQTCFEALKKVTPSAMREVQVQVPNVTWQDIGGLDELKLKLKQSVEWPIKHPEAFKRMGITAPKGVLMYGPPGCSKTMIAKALANESQLNFVAIKGPELFKKYVGESEQAVRQLFNRARRVSPCIVFFDEIDALGSERGSSSSKVGDRVLAQMLTEMDGIEQLKDVIVVAATNRPDMIDKALMRPGRLDRVVYVPLPDQATRLKIFQIHTKKKPLESGIDLEELAKITDDYSGAEIAAVCNEAALKALEETIKADDLVHPEITQEHFDCALKVIKPRINPKLLKIYEKFQA